MPHRGPPFTYGDDLRHETRWERRAIAVVFWLLIIAIIAIAISYALRPSPENDFEPLSGPVYGNAPVLVDRTTVQPGDTLTLTIARCIETDQPVLLFVSQRWERLDEPTAVPVSGGSTFAVREPGCREEQVSVSVPEQLVPGTWEMEVINGALGNTGAGIQVRTWKTEPVTVVPTAVVP